MFAIIFYCNVLFCQEMTKEEFITIDRYLTDNSILVENFIISKLLIHPFNDYLIGMNIYLNYKNGNRKHLEEEFNTLLKSDSNFKNSSYIELAKGIIEINNGNDNKALNHYLRSLELDKLLDNSNKWLRLELYSYFKERDHLLSLKYLNESLDIDPNFTSAQYEIAFLNRENGDLENAIKILDDIIIRIDDDYASYHKALFLEELGKYSEAEFVYSMLIKKSNYIQAYVGLGYINQFINKDLEKAELYFKQAINIDDRFDEAYMRLFRLYIEKKAPHDAHKYIKKAYELNNSDIYLLDLIYAETLLNNFEQSEKLINKYYTDYGKDYEIDFWDILITSLKGDKENSQSKINSYYDNYTTNEVEFLKNELRAWNINMVKP